MKNSINYKYLYDFLYNFVENLNFDKYLILIKLNENLKLINDKNYSEFIEIIDIYIDEFKLKYIEKYM
jgi:hypothetical protein